MTYQILQKQNQGNVSKDEQQIKAQRLAAAKNYLEQQLELAGQKKTILFEKHDSLVLFCDEQQKILASVQRGMLQVFFEISSKHGRMQHQAQSKVVLLEGIQSQRALYCKRCKKWLEFHDGLTRCHCGKYLKTRKRFFIHKNQIEDSDELAEIQFAIKDARNARRIKSKRKPVFLGPLSYECGGMICKFMDGPRSSSRLIDRIISIKIDGKKVPEECLAAITLGLLGPIEEQDGNVWTME